MSAPRTKRPFAGAASDPSQRQITSFFTRQRAGPEGNNSGGSPPPSLQQQQQLRSSSAPSLPAMVQSNLLSVGMRVRKSVPEGYKTGDACGSFSLWSDGPQKQPGRRTVSAAAAADNNVDPRSSSYAPLPGLSSCRELLPFCGIHNVGGLSSQPAFAPTPTSPERIATGAESRVPVLDDIPGLTSSQESIESAFSTSEGTPVLAATTANSSRKRTYHDEDDDDQQRQQEQDPRSPTPAGWVGPRVLAVPRNRKAFFLEEAGSGDDIPRHPGAPLQRQHATEQENMRVVGPSDDFDEADFLDYRYYSPDMEMSGM